jgi:hypothetical protein
VKEMSSGKPLINLATSITARWKEFYRQSSNSKTHGKTPVFGFLDQMEFVSSSFFLGNNSLLKSVYQGLRVVHANNESMLRLKGLWLQVKRNGVDICTF